MTHAEQRLIERVMHQANISETNAKILLNQAQKSAKECKFTSEAVRLKTIDFQGTAWTDKSNGDEIWAIIRDNKIVTIMFRRSTQPKTCKSLRVENVVY